jgi:Domain of unknown function (DUF4824)
MTRRWLLFVAALIVCATNLVALGMGLLNRRQAPAGAITLSERELPRMNFGPESTATILQVTWTTRDGEGFPCDRIRPLGFTCPQEPFSSDSREFSQPARTGYVALEYDGPAWEQVRKRREADAGEFAVRDPASPASISWALNHATRLVVIDVGADPDVLRRTYTDPSRYLISMARITARPMPVPDAPGVSKLSGFVAEMLPSTINVPLPFSTLIREAEASHSADPPQSWTPRYTVTLQYGRFLEPWIVDVRVP